MHVLVTGGCGFIGSHLVEALLARGDTVVILDDLSSGRSENVPDGATLMKGDVTNSKDVADAMSSAEVFFHLAANASVIQCHDDWYRSHCINQSGLVNILEKARQDRPVPVIYASSAAVYGDNPHVPLSEKETPAPLSSYSLDKYLCEVQAKQAGMIYGIPTFGLRFFNVYGPRQVPDSRYSGVISIFLDKAKKHESLTIHGDGTQQRDFIYVNDVVEALLLAREKASATGPIVNICTGTSISILDLAALINKLCLSEKPLLFAPPRNGDIKNSIGTPALAKEILGFRAQMSLEDGLKQTITAL